MSRRISAVFCCLCLLALAAVPALAIPKDCDEKCTPSTPDYIVCACPGIYQVSTCGAWFEECGFFLAPLPSDVGLPNSVLQELGIGLR